MSTYSHVRRPVLKCLQFFPNEKKQLDDELLSLLLNYCALFDKNIFNEFKLFVLSSL